MDYERLVGREQEVVAEVATRQGWKGSGEGEDLEEEIDLQIPKDAEG